MKNKFLHKGFLFGLCIIVILSFIPLLWFKGNQIIAGHDNVYPLQLPGFLRDRLFTWSLNHGVGYDQASVVRSLIIHVIDSAGYFLGTSLQTSEKIAFIFWIFAMLLSSFILVFNLERWQYIKTSYLKYIFPVLYVFNFYTLEAWWIAERIKFSFMVTMPLFLLILISLVRSKKSIFYHMLLAVVVCTIFNGGGWKGLPLYGGILVIAGTYIVYAIVTEAEKKMYLVGRFAQFFFSFFVLFIFVNAWSLFPFFTHTFAQYKQAIAANGGPSQVFGWVDMISKDTGFMNLFRFQGIPEWYSNPDHPYANIILSSPYFIFISFLFPVFLLLSFLFKKEKQEKNFFIYIVFVFLISMFFTAGSHPPLGFLFNLFILKVPLFAIFRTPIYKFGYAFWFAGGFLISYTLSKIIEFSERKIPIFLKFKLGYFFTILIIGGLLLYHFPFLTGNFFSWSKGQLENRIEVPSYVYQVTNWADKKNDSYRILLLPRSNTNWTGDTYTWKFFSLYPLTAFISRQPFLYNNDSLTKDETLLINGLYDAILNKDSNKIVAYSRLLKTKYFIVRNDYFSNLYWSPTESPDQYTNAIKANSQFGFVTSFGKWDIYTLTTSIPENHVVVSTNIVEYNKDNFINAPGIEAAINNGMENKIFIDNTNVSYVSNTNFSTDKVFTYSCITCEISLRDNAITFPRIWVYPDSPLYRVKGIVKSKVSKLTGETDLFDILGHTLISTQQVVDLVNYSGDKQESKNNAAIVSFTELHDLYRRIDQWIASNYTSDQAQIYYSPMILNYIDTEEEAITKTLSRKLDASQLGSQSYYYTYINYLSIYESLHNKVKTYEEGTSYLNDKVYYPTLTGDFFSFLLYKNEQEAISFKDAPLVINTIPLAPLTQISNYVSYNSFHFPNNAKIIQSIKNINLISTVHVEKNFIPLELGANTCIGGDIAHVTQGQAFNIGFSYLNDFNSNLQFTIYTKDKLDNSSPVLYSKNIGFDNKNQFSKQIPYIAAKNYDDIFVGFCADELTSYLFDTKLRLEIYQLFSPSLVTYQKGIESNLKPPTIAVNRVNQTKYIVTVTNAKNPYFLTFFEQFDPDWKVYSMNTVHSKNYGSTGDKVLERGLFDTWFTKPIASINHFTANGYMNGWFIDKMGSYSIIIEYEPQKQFYQGILISFVAVIGIIGFLVVKKMKK